MSDPQSRPFIYIGALIRTGSTLLSEALTRFPFSYIFHEPNLGRNVLAWNQADVKIWKARGAALDHATFIHKLAALFFRKTHTRPDYIVSLLKRRYLPVLGQHVEQIGVKETRNAGWVHYAKHIPGMKTILAATLAIFTFPIANRCSGTVQHRDFWTLNGLRDS